MSSTTINVGMAENKSSSRVLKPPGGGHTNIFAPPQEQVLKQRPKYNQQNSAMMSEIMGKNSEGAVCKENGAKDTPAGGMGGDVPAPKSVDLPKAADPPKSVETSKPAEPAGKTRVPPGGFSSGLW